MRTLSPTTRVTCTRLLLLLVASWLIFWSSAFTASRTPNLPPKHTIQRNLSPFLLQAIVYGQDGKIIPEEDQQKQAATDIFDDVTMSLVKQSVQSELGNVNAMLTRLACGFAPPPHDHLLPQQVVGATLQDITSKQVSIAIAVPAGNTGTDGGMDASSHQQLAQILVSVAFPEAIQSDKESQIVKSVISQMKQLDGLAIGRLQNREKEMDPQTVPSVKQQQELPQDLTEEPLAVDWPSWWTVPTLKIMLAEECKTLKSLLNEAEFTNELMALCKAHSNVQSLFIRLVKVASIGTSGVFLRAVVVGDDGTDGVMDVPIPFPGGEATTSDDLRDRVLTLIETVEVPVVAEPSMDEHAELIEPETSTTEVKAEVQQESESPTAVEEEEEEATPAKEPSREERMEKARQQPKSPQEESQLAAKYAAIEDVGERAFTILKDLYMI